MSSYRWGSSSKHFRKHSKFVKCVSWYGLVLSLMHGERLCPREGNDLRGYSWWVEEVSLEVLNEFVQGEKKLSRLTMPPFPIAWKAWFDICHYVSLSSHMEGCKKDAAPVLDCLKSMIGCQSLDWPFKSHRGLQGKILSHLLPEC